jgi:hypothetical protein
MYSGSRIAGGFQADADEVLMESLNLFLEDPPSSQIGMAESTKRHWFRISQGGIRGKPLLRGVFDRRQGSLIFINPPVSR